ncbi:MAG: glycine betaine/L-proline ABC transporter ATP-binding protein [Proteobacteria bacterium]|nr:glycine betaine/L-proline ABC transporter ATP-binding protein [Pseudomonadota bacterium]
MKVKIKVENLVKIFGKNPSRGLRMLEKGIPKDKILEKTGLSIGVNNASFDVVEGEILVIMGLSGSGKSTLVRCLNRLINPTSGKILVDGVDVAKLSEGELRLFRQNKFGMVFQNFALFPHRTVIQNTEYGLEIKGVDKLIRQKKAMEVLEQVGLNGWADYYPRQLSGGMQQRVGLARALALDPDILLMDEAFSALDPLIRKDMQDELIELQSRLGKTIVFISHDLDEALKLGDRIVLMKDGAIVQIGPPDEILSNPATRYVEKFVEDVDMSKVLTADTVKRKTDDFGTLGHDGPKSLLRKMDKAGISYIFIVTKNQAFVGMVTDEDAAEAVKKGETSIESIIRRDIKTVNPNSPATELLTIMKDLPHPLAVVTEQGRFTGVIIRGTLLSALSHGDNG